MEQKNIFSKFSGKSVFKNKDVLSINFIPNKIIHRDEQITGLTAALSPALKGYQPSNIFVYGKTGTGKSMSIRFVLDQLVQAASGKVSIKSIYVNCKMKCVADTEYRLFAQLLKELGVHVPDTGLPTDVLYRQFFEKIDEKKQIIILALDEIDTLVKKMGDEFLYNLTRAGSELKNAGISLVGITNDLSFSDLLDARVKSSLGEEEILFKPYNAIQLKDILNERVKAAFNDHTAPDIVISKCAALAAQEHGDARRALNLLRVAGEIAERNGSDTIMEEHVDNAEGKIDSDRIIESVRALPRQSQLVLMSVIKLCKENTRKEITTGDVFDKYRKICAEVGYKELTQRRVSDLVGELDMLGIITAVVVSTGRYGRSRKISLAISGGILENVESVLKHQFN
ncbi:MAG: orc1/cdc6 family replication initiation protein [Candidatus Aenigmatarchaeota archaeon]